MDLARAQQGERKGPMALEALFIPNSEGAGIVRTRRNRERKESGGTVRFLALTTEFMALPLTSLRCGRLRRGASVASILRDDRK